MSDIKIEDHSADVIAAKNAAIERALEAIGQQAVGYAKLLAPVDTGLLRNSLTHAVSGKETGISKYQSSGVSKKTGKKVPVVEGSYTGNAPSGEEAVYIGSNVEYAPYVEFGTQRTDAQPFLKPALQDHLDEYQKMAKEFLKGG